MINLVETRDLFAVPEHKITIGSELKFAEVVESIPGLIVYHEPFWLKNRGKTKPDFLILNSDSTVGALVEVTSGFLCIESKRIQVRKYGCGLSDNSIRDGVCLKESLIYHDNGKFPNPLSFLMIGAPAIKNSDLIRNCVERIMGSE